MWITVPLRVRRRPGGRLSRAGAAGDDPAGTGRAPCRGPGTLPRVNPQLRALLERERGLVTRVLAPQVVPDWVVEHASRSGHLRRILPGVYLDAAVPDTPALRRRAALAWLDGRGALSHTTALAVWGLADQEAGDAVHVTVPAAVRVRSHPGFQVHHVAGFAPEPPHVVTRNGLSVTSLERSSWTPGRCCR